MVKTLHARIVLSPVFETTWATGVGYAAGHLLT